MQCRDFCEVADSFLGDELLIETNHDVITHLESCAGCRRELAARRELRKTLRASFGNAGELQIRDDYASRLHSELRAAAATGAVSLNMRPAAWMIAAGIVLAVTLGTIAVWRQRTQTGAQTAAQHQPQNTTAIKASNAQPRPGDIAVDVNAILGRMSELAAGDHRDCAIGHRLPDRPISLDEAGRKHDRAFLELRQAVMSHRDDFNLVMAHACLFEGRWFAHVVVRHRGRLVSLLVTKLDGPNANASSNERLSNDPEGQVIACSAAEGFRISCFHTTQYAVFVVSDLEEGENLAFARRLAPSVYEHLTQVEQA